MKATGIVMKIRRAARHEGPGLRTAVFLKGTPVRRWWCRRPEAQSSLPEPVYDRRTGRMDVLGREMDTDEVLEMLGEDRQAFRESGGGLTVSGGEPLVQPGFTEELLRRAKKAGFSTCLDTCGIGEWALFERLLPHVDLFLYEIMETDPQRHELLAGIPNHAILSNLGALCARGARVVLRCPLASGINDRPSHFKGIARLLEKHPSLGGPQVLAIHGGRYRGGHERGDPCLPDCLDSDVESERRWMREFEALGCPKAELI